MRITDCNNEEKPSEGLTNSSAQSSVLGSQSLNTRPALSPHCFQKICTDLLTEGKRVRFKAPGKSMYPVILDGETVIVEPVAPSAVRVGDIILYKSEENLIAHRIIWIEKVHSPNTQPPALHNQYSFILRGDASYSYDEPVYPDQILGKVITLERNGRRINPYSLKHKFSCWARIWGARLKRTLLRCST